MSIPLSVLNAAPPNSESADERKSAQDAGDDQDDARSTLDGRIDKALNEPMTLEIIEGTQFLDVLRTLARKHQIPIRFDDTSFFSRGITFNRLAATSFHKIKLREAISKLFEAALPSGDVQLAMRPSHGTLVLAATGGHSLTGAYAKRVPVRAISGTVHDLDGKPVSALVEIVNRFDYSFIMADASGRFRINLQFDPMFGMSATAVDVTSDQTAFWSLPSDWEGTRSVPPLALVMKPPRRLIVAVLDQADRPVANADVIVTSTYSDFFDGRTDENGRVSIAVPRDCTVRLICAKASGKGADYISYFDQRVYSEPERKHPPQPDGAVQLVLSGPNPITLNVRDEDGKPVSGLRFYPWYLQKPDDHGVEFNLSMMRRFGREGTNSEGVVVFDWLPGWKHGLGMTQFWHESRDYVHQRVIHDPQKSANGVVEVTVQKFVELSGRVVNADGTPLAGAKIQAVGAGYHFDNCRASATTDDDGNYSFKLAPHQIYLFTATSTEGNLSGARDGVLVYPRLPQKEIDVTVQKSTRIFGKVTIGDTRRPVKEQQIQFYQYGKALNEFKDAQFPNPDNQRTWVCPTTVHSTKTNDDGRFEFWLGAGQFDIRGPDQSKIEKFTITEPKELEFNFHVEREDKGPFRGKVISGEPSQPVAEASVHFTARATFGDMVSATTKQDGSFHVIRKRFPSVFYASNKDRTLAGLIEVGADDEEGTIEIFPTATCTARILDGKTPVTAGRIIQYGVKIRLGEEGSPWMTLYGGNAVVGEDGRVTLDKMVVGSKYSVSLEAEDKNSWRHITEITPENPQPKDLGDLAIGNK